jgi:hypothetical protein
MAAAAGPCSSPRLKLALLCSLSHLGCMLPFQAEEVCGAGAADDGSPRHRQDCPGARHRAGARNQGELRRSAPHSASRPRARVTLGRAAGWQNSKRMAESRMQFCTPSPFSLTLLVVCCLAFPAPAGALLPHGGLGGVQQRGEEDGSADGKLPEGHRCVAAAGRRRSPASRARSGWQADPRQAACALWPVGWSAQTLQQEKAANLSSLSPLSPPHPPPRPAHQGDQGGVRGGGDGADAGGDGEPGGRLRQGVCGLACVVVVVVFVWVFVWVCMWVCVCVCVVGGWWWWWWGGGGRASAPSCWLRCSGAASSSRLCRQVPRPEGMG